MAEKIRILIIDDEPGWAKLAISELEEDHYVIDATDSLANLTPIFQRDAQYDVVIIDLGIPGQTRTIHSGRDAAQEFIDRGAAVALFTGDKSYDAIKTARSIGVPIFDKNELAGSNAFGKILTQIFSTPEVSQGEE